MWQQLSFSQKSWLVRCCLAAPLNVAVAILTATADRWFVAATFAVVGVAIAYTAIAFLISKNRGLRDSQPRTINSGP
jgi:hypothetical protein